MKTVKEVGPAMRAEDEDNADEAIDKYTLESKEQKKKGRSGSSSRQPQPTKEEKRRQGLRGERKENTRKETAPIRRKL